MNCVVPFYKTVDRDKLFQTILIDFKTAFNSFCTRVIKIYKILASKLSFQNQTQFWPRNHLEITFTPSELVGKNICNSKICSEFHKSVTQPRLPISLVVKSVQDIFLAQLN